MVISHGREHEGFCPCNGKHRKSLGKATFYWYWFLWDGRFSSILGTVNEVKQRSRKERWLRKKYMGEWRWDSIPMTAIIIRFPIRVRRWIHRKSTKNITWMWRSADSPRSMNSVMVLWFPKARREGVPLEWKQKEVWSIHLLFMPSQSSYFIPCTHMSLFSLLIFYKEFKKSLSSFPKFFFDSIASCLTPGTMSQSICLCPFPLWLLYQNSSGELYLIFQSSLWLTGFILSYPWWFFFSSCTAWFAGS